MPFSVLILDMAERGEGRRVDGFPTVALAREYARRYTRDSLEELRGGTGDLRTLFAIYGEDAVVLGDGYAGFSEIDFLVAHPATPEERDWKAVLREAGLPE